MSSLEIIANLAIIALLVTAIATFRAPRPARLGNHAAAIALLAAIGLVLV
jgi:hypothetical protein